MPDPINIPIRMNRETPHTGHQTDHEPDHKDSAGEP